MTQTQLRLRIFILWISFWIVSSLVLLLSPLFRHDIETADLLPAVLTISGIWIPAVSCLAGFWFPQRGLTQPKSVRVSKERSSAAAGVTLIYLVFVMGLLIYSIYFVRANVESAEPSNLTLLSQLSESVKIALLISPIALAPISWLTGGIDSVKDSKDKVENTAPAET
jgi:hypothetical protein